MNEMVESFKPEFRMLGGVFALLVVLRIFLLWWNSPKRKGARGEKLVAGRFGLFHHQKNSFNAITRKRAPHSILNNGLADSITSFL